MVLSAPVNYTVVARSQAAVKRRLLIWIQSRSKYYYYLLGKDYVFHF